MDVLTSFIVVITMYTYIKTSPYTDTLFICQSYLSKAGGKKSNLSTSETGFNYLHLSDEAGQDM